VSLSARPGEDVLSRVLREVRLVGAVFFDVDARAPWVANAPPTKELAPLVMPEAQHLIAYHVVVSGSCWVEATGATTDPIEVSAGSVIIFPMGDPHVLSSQPGLCAPFDPAIFDEARPEDLTPFMLTRTGEGTEGARLICGFLGCDALPFNPLLRSLPRTLIVRGGYHANDGWLRRLLDASFAELAEDREGGLTVLSRLSELVFIEAVRIHAGALAPEARGWLNGLRHPTVGPALGLLHERPGDPWTVAALARAVGASRTVLAGAFKEQVGVPPMTYLTRWRMQIASRLLTNPRSALAEVADAVGYSSEAAFSRAFKRATGSSPGGWRDAHEP
jgi:AraC-like DNA-binding protein